MDDRIRMLLIDDDEVDRAAFRRVLNRCDLEVDLREACDAAAGIRMLEEHEFDCVILDYWLPGRDASDVLPKLIAERSQPPAVIVVTGGGSERMALTTMEAGAVDFFTKDELNPALLERSVRYALARRKFVQTTIRRHCQQLELKDRFLSHVSREFRTPVNAIRQVHSLLLDEAAGELGAQQREYLETSAHNARKLTKMVADLRDATRADSGKLRVEICRVAPRPLILESVRGFRNSARGKLISLQAEVADDLPSVLADGYRVRGVLDNLIENAIKFTPPEGSVRVSAGVDPGDGGSIRISVSDSGCGLSEEGTGEIFDWLHPKRTEESEGGKGLGLGLFISRHLMARQDGRIWVESRLGEGCSFHFTLPVFSLQRIVAPAVLEGAGLRDAYSVIRVDFASADTGDCVATLEAVARRLSYAVRSSMSPNIDVMLPRHVWNGNGKTSWVVAGTGAAGMNSRVEQIRKRLDDFQELKSLRVQARVEGHVEETRRADRLLPTCESLPSVAHRIEELIEDQSCWKIAHV